MTTPLVWLAVSAKGKAVGYMSIPLSTLGGGVFGVNREVGWQRGLGPSRHRLNGADEAG